jgi:hypothetical protein
MTPIHDAYALDEQQAKTVATALIKYNDYLVGEFNKIANSPDASDFVKAAAHQQYQMLAHDATQLHLSLADTFASLRQGQGPTPS